jgi:predicted Zn-dependent protease
VVRAEEDTTMEQLAEESPITNYALDTLRVMNGLYPHGQPEDGQLIKIVN